jgi:hypothetical protein
MVIKLNEYDSLLLAEYQGKYRIEIGKEKDGKWFATKCRKYFFNKEMHRFELSQKDGNLSISLGDKENAVLVLNALYDELVSGLEGREDVPF